MQPATGSHLTSGLGPLRAGSGCDPGDGAPVTPGLTCSWNTEFEPTADTVSVNAPRKTGSIDPLFTLFFTSIRGNVGRDELGPLGIEDFAASGPELVAWALVSPPLVDSAG